MSASTLDPTTPAAKAPRAPVGWALVFAAIGATAALLRFMNPWTGVAARHWPWVVDTPLAWSRNFATQVFFAAVIVVPLVAAFCRPGRLRGVIVGTAAALSLTALADISVLLYGVESYVAPLLATIVAAGLYVGRTAVGGGAGRVVAGVAGAVLLGLLLYPQLSDAKPDPRRRNPNRDYHAVLPTVLGEIAERASESEGERRAAVEAGRTDGGLLEFLAEPWTTGVLLFAFLGILGVVGSLGSFRPWIAWTALGTFLVAAVYPPIWYGIEAHRHAQDGPGDLSASAAAAIGVAHSLREQYAPFLLALFAATVDLARPRPSRDPAKP